MQKPEVSNDTQMLRRVELLCIRRKGGFVEKGKARGIPIPMERKKW